MLLILILIYFLYDVDHHNFFFFFFNAGLQWCIIFKVIVDKTDLQ